MILLDKNGTIKLCNHEDMVEIYDDHYRTDLCTFSVTLVSYLKEQNNTMCVKASTRKIKM